MTGVLVLLCGSFFFASAAASAGYLTVSEIFPLETRAMSIALFYAISTGIGGAVGPVLFGSPLSSGERFCGPGRFRSALAHARREGRIRRAGRRGWEVVPR